MSELTKGYKVGLVEPTKLVGESFDGNLLVTGNVINLEFGKTIIKLPRLQGFEVMQSNGKIFMLQKKVDVDKMIRMTVEEYVKSHLGAEYSESGEWTTDNIGMNNATGEDSYWSRVNNGLESEIPLDKITSSISHFKDYFLSEADILNVDIKDQVAKIAA